MPEGGRVRLPAGPSEVPPVVGLPRIRRGQKEIHLVALAASDAWEGSVLEHALSAEGRLRLVSENVPHSVRVVADRDWTLEGSSCLAGRAKPVRPRTVVVSFYKREPGAALLRCDGYFVRGAPLDMLPQLVLAVANGRRLYVVRRPVRPEQSPSCVDRTYVCLTGDEVDLLEGLAAGKVCKAIASDMAVSRGELNRDLAILREKLQVNSTHEAVFLWGRLRLWL